jgi:hypothetical protein
MERGCGVSFDLSESGNGGSVEDVEEVCNEDVDEFCVIGCFDDRELELVLSLTRLALRKVRVRSDSSGAM